MKNKKEIWMELRNHLEKFEEMQKNPQTAMVEMTTQRLRIEELLRQLDDMSEKVA